MCSRDKKKIGFEINNIIHDRVVLYLSPNESSHADIVGIRVSRLPEAKRPLEIQARMFCTVYTPTSDYNHGRAPRACGQGGVQDSRWRSRIVCVSRRS